jgi:hypothetical protein
MKKMNSCTERCLILGSRGPSLNQSILDEKGVFLVIVAHLRDEEKDLKSVSLLRNGIVFEAKTKDPCLSYRVHVATIRFVLAFPTKQGKKEMHRTKQIKGAGSIVDCSAQSRRWVFVVMRCVFVLFRKSTTGTNPGHSLRRLLFDSRQRGAPAERIFLRNERTVGWVQKHRRRNISHAKK